MRGVFREGSGSGVGVCLREMLTLIYMIMHAKQAYVTVWSGKGPTYLFLWPVQL